MTLLYKNQGRFSYVISKIIFAMLLAIIITSLTSCQAKLIEDSERKADCISYCASKGMSLSDDPNCYSVDGFGDKTFCRCEGVT